MEIVYGTTLLLAALLVVGTWMVLRRLRLTEDRLRDLPVAGELRLAFESLRTEIEKLERLDQAVAAVARQVEELPRPLGKAEWEATDARVIQIQNAVRHLEARLEIVTRTAALAAEQAAPADDSLLLQLLRQHLEQDGFEDIRVLTELESTDPTEEHRVPVEARRNGTAFKGSVTLAEGRVADVNLRPSYGAFP